MGCLRQKGKTPLLTAFIPVYGAFSGRKQDRITYILKVALCLSIGYPLTILGLYSVSFRCIFHLNTEDARRMYGELTEIIPKMFNR
jgi:hypothetical protein